MLRVTFYPHSEIKSQFGAEAPRHQVKTDIEYEVVVKQICEYCKVPRTMREILSFLNRTDRTKFRNRFIYPLIEKGMLKLTIPDKPNSSNQRYVTTGTG